MYYPVKILISFFIILFLFTGCLSKQNGKYHTQYSYHPYYKLYKQKMSDIKSPNQKTKKKKVTRRPPIPSFTNIAKTKTKANPFTLLKEKTQRYPKGY